MIASAFVCMVLVLKEEIRLHPSSLQMNSMTMYRQIVGRSLVLWLPLVCLAFLQARHVHPSLTVTVVGVDVVRLSLKAATFLLAVEKCCSTNFRDRDPRSFLWDLRGAALLYTIFRIRIW